jgi:hypothetical protein
MRIRNMEDAHGTHNHEQEVRGLNINLGNEETQSNGYRSRVEPIELVKAMKSLRMEAKRYRDNNERIVRVQEDQNHINTLLLQSLNQL